MTGELGGTEPHKGMRPHRDDAAKPQPLSSRNVFDRVSQPILAAASYIPSSSEPKASDPERRANELTSKAALEAAALSGTLAAPLGPYGLIMIIPDLLGMWRIQCQLVADIAAAYGKSHFLTAEAMFRCLFKMAAAHVLRDGVVRAGERVLIRRLSMRAMQRIAQLGFKVTQRLIGRATTRVQPIIGTLGSAAYAYCDTRQVGKNTIELFGGDGDLGPELTTTRPQS
jgi:hypothetical protein